MITKLIEFIFIINYKGNIVVHICMVHLKTPGNTESDTTSLALVTCLSLIGSLLILRLGIARKAVTERMLAFRSFFSHDGLTLVHIKTYSIYPKEASQNWYSFKLVLQDCTISLYL